jgi:hypothetical protein
MRRINLHARQYAARRTQQVPGVVPGERQRALDHVVVGHRGQHLKGQRFRKTTQRMAQYM